MLVDELRELTNNSKQYQEEYEGKIPEPYYSKLKDAMYNYEVEIDD